MKDIKIILSEEASIVYEYLKKEAKISKVEKSILNSLNKKIKQIKQDPHLGNPISKNLFPKEYIKKFSISNLFRIELPNYWRMLYTITNNDYEIEIIAFVIEILDHKRYNKKFKYRST